MVLFPMPALDVRTATQLARSLDRGLVDEHDAGLHLSVNTRAIAE
jgi:hypothetical protein